MKLDEPPYFYQCKNCKRRFSLRRKKRTINLVIFKINSQKCPYCKSSRIKNIDNIVKTAD
ncbi:hypothetical protein BFL38_09305 [Brachyspira hampsonii]|uniref:Zinc ribbon domain-containing protein n=1 Tax=Brachyspira hampsonii TaxID=1287055 RepID=A0A1E5NHM2_9SPIR|nr:hypothetical protein [Brachyspira hampsonii]OEJ15658.1 hypothetical protein BFL38_09305 [Brachyspira hampsonii]